MDIPSYYAIIPSEVRYCKDLEPCARLLYGELTALANMHGYAYATNGYFAELYNVDSRTIRRWLSCLSEKGFIHIEHVQVSNKEERRIYINHNFKRNFREDINVRGGGQKCPPNTTSNKRAAIGIDIDKIRPKRIEPPPKPKRSQQDSIPLDEDNFFDENTASILEMEDQYRKYFKPHVVATWLRKFGSTVVLKTILFFFKVLSYQKKSIDNPEAWMEKALKDNFVENNDICDRNKNFAETLKKENDLKSLVIKQRYCINADSGDDFYYHLPEQQFQYLLRRMVS